MSALIGKQTANSYLKFLAVSGCLMVLMVVASPRHARCEDADQGAPKQLAATNPDEINDRLANKRVSAKFEAVPLADAIDYIGNIAEVNTFIDWKALEPLGIDANAQVTLKLRNPVSAAQALRLVLRTVYAGLSYNVEDEVVVIAGSADAPTPQEQAPADVETRVYDVTDLVAGASNADALVQLVTNSITPDVWKGDASSSRATLLGSRLVVTAPQPTHDQINELFGKLRHATLNGVVPETPAQSDKRDDK